MNWSSIACGSRNASSTESFCAMRLPSRGLRDETLHGLTKLHSQVLRRHLHGKIFAEIEHRRLPIAVQFMHRSPLPNEKVVPLPQGTQHCADLHMELGIVARIGRDQRGRRTAVTEICEWDEIHIVRSSVSWPRHRVSGIAFRPINSGSRGRDSACS